MLVRSEAAERAATVLLPIARGVDRHPGVARVLRGDPLGHPLHPALTDLPIGFWTSAWVLDLLPGEGRQRAAQRLIGLGVLSALPTAATGVADWPRLRREKDATAVVHLTSMITATALYASSWRARRRGLRLRGFVLAQLGAGVATAGAYFGGVLAFGPDRDADELERAHVAAGRAGPVTAAAS